MEREKLGIVSKEREREIEQQKEREKVATKAAKKKAKDSRSSMDSRSCFNMTYFQQCEFVVFVERTQQEHEGRILMHKKTIFEWIITISLLMDHRGFIAQGCCCGIIKKERQGRKRLLSRLEGLAQFK